MDLIILNCYINVWDWVECQSTQTKAKGRVNECTRRTTATKAAGIRACCGDWWLPYSMSAARLGLALRLGRAGVALTTATRAGWRTAHCVATRAFCPTAHCKSATWLGLVPREAGARLLLSEGVGTNAGCAYRWSVIRAVRGVRELGRPDSGLDY